VPRKRNSSFEPAVVPKGQHRRDGIDAMVISLYARGITVRDIRAHLAQIYDVDLRGHLSDVRSDPELTA
jgi:putative transposase